MKRNFVLIVTIVIVVCTQFLGAKAMATNIDEITARQLGTYYLSVMSGNQIADEEQVSLVYTFMNPELNIPAAYIFNVDKQGFVIVSGSDLWYPILGYSTEGLLDTNNMAPSFKWYFEGLCEYIIYSQNTGRQLINDIDQEWDELKYQKLPDFGNIKAQYWLMDAEWGQGSTLGPTYNKFCPHKLVDGFNQTAYVGCVATAMSQIMHYWKYPINPVDGYIGYACELDSVFYEDVNIDMSQVSYNYDMMPNKLTSMSTGEEINAVALLCYHAGVSVEMGYGLMASYAWSHNVAPALGDVFLYDSTMMRYVERTASKEDDAPIIFTNEEWDAMLSTEIAAGRPIYYSGYSKTGEGRDAGGHAFVCDGKHPSKGKYHFNWGWDGQANMWCDVRNNDLSVYDYNFNIYQEMVIGIQPKGHIAGIEDVEINFLSVYPNPATTYISISYELNGKEGNVMEIYGVDGKLMDKVLLNQGRHTLSLNVSKYPQGVYVYRIGSICRKFIVH